MNENEQLQLFEDQAIRTAWDEENEEWYFSVVDVVSVLTDAKDYDTARNYWKVTKKRLKLCGRYSHYIWMGMVFARLSGI